MSVPCISHHFTSKVNMTLSPPLLQLSVIRKTSLQQDWIVLADIDEHQVYPGNNLTKFLDLCSERGISVVSGILRDRVSRCVCVCVCVCVNFSLLLVFFFSFFFLKFLFFLVPHSPPDTGSWPTSATLIPWRSNFHWHAV